MFSEICPMCQSLLKRGYKKNAGKFIYFYCSKGCYQIGFDVAMKLYAESVFIRPYEVDRYYNGLIHILDNNKLLYSGFIDLDIYSLNEDRVKKIIILI